MFLLLRVSFGFVVDCSLVRMNISVVAVFRSVAILMYTSMLLLSWQSLYLATINFFLLFITKCLLDNTVIVTVRSFLASVIRYYHSTTSIIQTSFVGNNRNGNITFYEDICWTKNEPRAK
jgi:hypothetical protein